MQEYLNAIGGRLDAFSDWLREQSIAYPWVTAVIGGMLLMSVFSYGVFPYVRLAWWRCKRWSRRMTDKWEHWNYDTDVADAIVAITNRYWLAGRLSDGQRKEKFRLLGNALSLPELHATESYQKLRAYEARKLRRKTEAELEALKNEPVHPVVKPRPQLKLVSVKATAA